MAGRSTEFIKHVVLITPGFAKDANDSTCIPHLQLFAENLSKKGVRISIITLHYPFSKQPYLWNGIEVYPLGGANKKWKKRFLQKQARKVFSEISKKETVDSIHAFWLNQATVIAQSISERFNVPLVASAMGQGVKSENRHLKFILQKKIPVVALSTYQERLLSQSGIKAIGVINPQVRTVPTEAKNLDVVAVGSLIPLKNFSYALELFHSLHRKGIVFSAKLIGQGPEEKMLRNRISELGISDVVQLTGELPHQETLKAIASAKVLVHPSHFEGYGLIVDEALLSGTHVMAQPVGAAFDNPDVVHLTMHPEMDAGLLAALLKMPPKVIDTSTRKDEAESYLEIYNRLKR